MALREGDTAPKAHTYVDHPSMPNYGNQQFHLATCECGVKIELTTYDGELVEYVRGTQKLHKCDRSVPEAVKLKPGKQGMKYKPRKVKK